MGVISGILSFLLCGWVYIRMYKREIPEPMTKRKLVIPVVVGMAAPMLSVLMVILFGYIVRGIWGGTIAELVPSLVLRALISSFLGAGFTEEFVKCLLILLMVKILKPKNVYEYIVFGAGVGFGFTLLEEIGYGSSSGAVIAISRLISFAMHMVWGVIMGAFFGRARYNRENGLGGSGKLIFLGCFIPVLWHTLYDAATANNAPLAMENAPDTVLLISVLCALVAIIVTDVLQFVLLVKYKKKTEQYCNMVFNEEETAA